MIILEIFFYLLAAFSGLLGILAIGDPTGIAMGLFLPITVLFLLFALLIHRNRLLKKDRLSEKIKRQPAYNNPEDTNQRFIIHTPDYIPLNSDIVLPEGVKPLNIINNFGESLDRCIQFSPDSKKWSALFVDEDNKEFYIMQNEEMCRYQYGKISDFEYSENGQTLVSGKTGATIVGGLAFGLIGAIAGSSGKRKSAEIIHQMEIKLKLNDLSKPFIKIPIFNGTTGLNSSKYTEKIQEADEIMATLNYMKNTNCDSNNSQNNTNQKNSPIDEIMKFKQLLDNEIITQEEFELKKKQLLDL